MSWSRTQRFRVRQVTSSSWRNHLPHPVFGDVLGAGTASTTVEYSESHNGLLSAISDFDDIYRGRGSVVGVGFGPRDRQGRHKAFRWVWERGTAWGRVTDALFVTVDSWE